MAQPFFPPLRSEVVRDNLSMGQKSDKGIPPRVASVMGKRGPILAFLSMVRASNCIPSGYCFLAGRMGSESVSALHADGRSPTHNFSA